MIQRLLAALLCALLLQPAGAASPPTPVDRVEPPHWWTGMADPRLQLMLHGRGIAAFTPALRHPGVRITGVQRTSNPNYLFIDLHIAPGTRPGTLDLRLQRGSQVLHQPYALLAREPGSAQRKGYSAADVILNLVPDRFANGNPANDDLPGFADKANRASDAAGRHGGDIQGIVDHLDDLAGMGYTMLWPTPLIENNQPNYSYHGYAATDLYKIDARFGSNEDYRRMVALARQKGIGIIQDIVLNHIGSGHWWMQDLPAPDWLTNGGRFVPTEHFRTAVSDPYASQADKRNFTEGWFTENMPDMNQRNPLVATYQIQNSIWWIEYAGLAGVRVDTYGYSDTAFLSEWSRRVMQEYPKLNIVGEEWSGNPVVVSYWLRGHRNRDGFVSHTPGMMDFPLHEALRRALVADDGMFTGLSDLYAALANDQLYPEPMNMVLFEGNHDVPRLFSVLREDLALTKMALAYVLTMPRVPQLYYGTDVLMTSPTQRDDGATRRDYPGGWAGDTVSGFTGAGLSAEQKEMQGFLKRLLNWRKAQPAIHRGKLMHYAPDRGTYAWFRYDGTQRVMVVINKSRQAVPLATERFEEALAGRRTGTDVLSGQVHDLAGTLNVPARSVLVLALK
jgi:neopullulanase